MAFRVPVPDCSVVDLTVRLGKPVSLPPVNPPVGYLTASFGVGCGSVELQVVWNALMWGNQHIGILLWDLVYR